MSSNVIPFHYQGQPVRFNSEGWINATDIAAAHCMRLDNWLRNKETEAYIEALARHLNTSDSRDLIRGQRGRGGGTWLHPKLAEPPRVLRRLQHLRRWSYDQVKQVLTRGPRACRTHGAGAPSRLPFAVGSH
ncbi:TPA: KilA-N domain-containing protein [Pseudomonas aeruginosa]|nr:KilA-N domain-containing protein [Pseudomonas aeruginosa]